MIDVHSLHYAFYKCQAGCVLPIVRCPLLPQNCSQALSNLSPWLHFGQLAPQRAALEAAKLRSKHRESVEGFLEELVRERELVCVFAGDMSVLCLLLQMRHNYKGSLGQQSYAYMKGAQKAASACVFVSVHDAVMAVGATTGVGWSCGASALQPLMLLMCLLT
jgi:hypothetical protein